MIVGREGEIGESDNGEEGVMGRCSDGSENVTR